MSTVKYGLLKHPETGEVFYPYTDATLVYGLDNKINTRIQQIVGAAPAALDTLEEIADKLADQDDAVAGIVNTISSLTLDNIADGSTRKLANYLPLSGGTMTGNIKWTNSTSLPENTSPQYFLTIDAFASGGSTKWAGLANVKAALGINDKADKVSMTAGTYSSVSVNSQGLVTGGTNPTTLAGYGITDAKIQNGVITLGSNTITPLTSFTESDPIFSNSAASGITSTDISLWNSCLTSVSVTGSGNVVTDVGVSGNAVTVTKGTISQGSSGSGSIGTASSDTDAWKTVVHDASLNATNVLSGNTKTIPAATATVDGYMTSEFASQLITLWAAHTASETWPTLTKSTIMSPTALKTISVSFPTVSVGSYKAGSTAISANGLYNAGSSVTNSSAISISKNVTYNNNSNQSYVYTNRISGITYGYSTTIGGTKVDSTTRDSSSLTLTPAVTTSNATGTFTVKLNSNTAKSSTASGSNTVLAASTALGNVQEGSNTITLVYTNNSTIARAAASGSIPAIGNTYYYSSIGNQDTSHNYTVAAETKSISAVSATKGGDSNSGTKTVTLTFYGAYPFYTTGSASSASAFSTHTDGTTGTTNNAFASLVNYSTNGNKTYYVKFGTIPHSGSTARILLPVKTSNTGSKTLSVTAAVGFNSVANSYSGTSMTVTKGSTTTISGVTYNIYTISAPTTASQGANSYQITINVAN